MNFFISNHHGSHAEQTAGVMVAYEKILLETPPDWVVVVGDVNSTVACSLAAKKLCLRVAHLEAGLRSGDRTMPEEINRIVTDSISDVLWTPSLDGNENLSKEGVAAGRISFVGNIMIDSYELMREQIEKAGTREELGLPPFQSDRSSPTQLHESCTALPRTRGHGLVQADFGSYRAALRFEYVGCIF